MKIKRCAVLLVLLLALTSCTAKQTSGPQDLEINIPEPCTTGTLIVYSAGAEAFQYRGEIEIVNDGRDGEPVEIIIKAGDPNE